MKTRLHYFFMVVLSGLLLVNCSSGGSSEDPCKGIDCSDHGTCRVENEQPVCDCETGYMTSTDGIRCIPGSEDPCRPYDCSNHGRCQTDAEDNPYCDCDVGYWHTTDGLDCIENSCVDACTLMGCCGTRCCKLVPSNAADIGQLPDSGANKSASGSFDTTTNCTAGSSLGDCEVVILAHSPDVCVCRLGDLNISGSLSIVGDNVLAILASGSVTIGGSINIAANGQRGGPGAEAHANAATDRLGGKGGSFGTAGGNGGQPRSNRELVPLYGGQNGQGGCGERSGGGGGGGIQISAAGSITMSGSINASGGGGTGGAAAPEEFCCGGAGGGSGGGILLEAPEVTISGSAIIYAHGGGAGGGGNNRGATGGAGSPATQSMNPAGGGEGRDGATCPLYGAIEGGDGGEGSVADSTGSNGQATDRNMCDPDQPYVGGGGGGGGSGRTRIVTSAASACDCNGTISPSETYGVIEGD